MSDHGIELSHDKPRLAGPRLSALGTVPTAAQRARNQGPDGRALPRNKLAANRAAKSAAKRHLVAARARIRAAVQKALDDGAAPEVAALAGEESDRILADALTHYLSARRDLTSDSVLVVGPLALFGAELAVANALVAEAVKAGITTPAGIALHDRALAAEQSMTRLMTASIAAAKALGGRRPKRTKLAQIEAAAEAPE